MLLAYRQQRLSVVMYSHALIVQALGMDSQMNSSLHAWRLVLPAVTEVGDETRPESSRTRT